MAQRARSDLARLMARADPKRPLAPALRLVQLALSVVFFLSLDLADFALCYVFLALDSLAGDHWGACYCRAIKPRIGPSPALPPHSGARRAAEAESERDGTCIAGPGEGVKGEPLAHGSDSSARMGSSLSIASSCNPSREDTPLLASASAGQVGFQESQIFHLRKATVQVGGMALTLPFSRPLSSMEPLLKRARTEPRPVCTLAAHVPQLSSSPAIVGAPPRELLPLRQNGSAQDGAAQPNPSSPHDVFLKLEISDLEGDGPLADEPPLVSPAQGGSSRAQWRTGLRWTDCRCPDCEAPEKEPGRRLYVRVVDGEADTASHGSAPSSGGGALAAQPSGEQDCTGASLLSGLQDVQCNMRSEARNGAGEEGARADAIFLHGFCSSSSFWADTVLPHFSPAFLRGRRLLLVDLLGFGKSPKPRDCQYTVGEHAQRIEKDVLSALKVRRFHIVAHSMGCTVALALAARNPSCVASITLFSPPFVVLEPGSASPGTEFFRFSAPRLLGPGMDIGISIMAWYEHMGRMLCCVLNKGHRLWEPLAAAILRGSRVPLSFVRDFMRHTHHSAWHCYYNTICEGANLYPVLLDQLGTHGLSVHIVHGEEDTLCPIQATRQLAAQHPCVRVSEVSGEDHVTVVLGREAEAAVLIEEQIARAEQEAAYCSES